MAAKETSMFLGALLHSQAEGFVPRPHRCNSRWTHWKIHLVRARYSDSWEIGVVCTISRAYQVGKRWVSEKKPKIIRNVFLGNLPPDQARIRTLEQCERQDPQIVAELTAALEGVKRHLEQPNFTFRPDEVDIQVHLACLQPNH